MNVDLWVTALRILAAVLTVSIVWPGLLELRRRGDHASGLNSALASPKRGAQ